MWLGTHYNPFPSCSTSLFPFQAVSSDIFQRSTRLALGIVLRTMRKWKGLSHPRQPNSRPCWHTCSTELSDRSRDSFASFTNSWPGRSPALQFCDFHSIILWGCWDFSGFTWPPQRRSPIVLCFSTLLPLSLAGCSSSGRSKCSNIRSFLFLLSIFLRTPWWF